MRFEINKLEGVAPLVATRQFGHMVAPFSGTQPVYANLENTTDINGKNRSLLGIRRVINNHVFGEAFGITNLTSRYNFTINGYQDRRPLFKTFAWSTVTSLSTSHLPICFENLDQLFESKDLQLGSDEFYEYELVRAHANSEVREKSMKNNQIDLAICFSLMSDSVVLDPVLFELYATLISEQTKAGRVVICVHANPKG